MGDFCFSRPMLDRIFRQAELMDRMIERVGAKPAAIARVDRGMAWYEARTKCIDCRHEQACRDWLERSPASPAQPDFCANAELFRSCLKSSGSEESPSSPRRSRCA